MITATKPKTVTVRFIKPFGINQIGDTIDLVPSAAGRFVHTGFAKRIDGPPQDKAMSAPPADKALKRSRNKLKRQAPVAE